MDNFEKEIINILNKKILVPEVFHITIKNALNNQKENKYNNFKRILVTSLTSLMLTTGLVFAGYTAYEKIWKEPIKYNTYEEVNNLLITDEITEEEKQNIITEEIAKEKALEFLKNLGYQNEEINRIELKRDYSEKEGNKSYYMVKTKYGYEEGLMILVDSKYGNITYFHDFAFESKISKAETILKEKAIQIANSIYESLEIKDGEYELSSIDEIKGRNEWKVKFCKNNNGILSNYESLSFSFIFSNGRSIYDTITINTHKEKIDNPIVVTKEEAIEIAKNKEEQLTDVEITNISVEQSIERLNTFIYQLENEIYITDPSKGGTYLEVPEATRNIWKVCIQHNNKKDKNKYEDYNQYIKENYDKYYYIDVTTGEIIGGDICK